MNMIKAELRRNLKSFAIWTVLLIAVNILFMSFFPSMKSSGMSELIKAKMSAIPEGMRESLGISSFIDFSDLLQYFAYCWQYILIALCLYSALLGSNSLIKEESGGTIEFLYAKPVTRLKIAVMKLCSAIILLITLSVILFAANFFILLVMRSGNYNFINGLTEITVTSFYACMLFLSVSFAASALLHNVSQASPFALGIFFITYIFGIISSVVKDYKFLKYFSPYHYVMPSDILKSGSLKTSYALIIVLVILLGIITGISVYRKKDFRI